LIFSSPLFVTFFFGFHIISINSQNLAAIEQFLPAHLEYLHSLETTGVLFGAGPLFTEDNLYFIGDGLIIIRAQSIVEATEIAATDPFHQNQVRHYQIRPWLLNEGSIDLAVSYFNSTVKIYNSGSWNIAFSTINLIDNSLSSFGRLTFSTSLSAYLSAYLSPPQLDGETPVAPSAIAGSGRLHTPIGKVDLETPRALKIPEIAEIVEQFRSGAVNAMKAGFDGVELYQINKSLRHIIII
jgi:uncharacterized protein YciI